MKRLQSSDIKYRSVYALISIYASICSIYENTKKISGNNTTQFIASFVRACLMAKRSLLLEYQSLYENQSGIM